MIDFTIV